MRFRGRGIGYILSALLVTAIVLAVGVPILLGSYRILSVDVEGLVELLGRRSKHLTSCIMSVTKYEYDGRTVLVIYNYGNSKVKISGIVCSEGYLKPIVYVLLNDSWIMTYDVPSRSIAAIVLDHAVVDDKFILVLEDDVYVEIKF